MATKASLTGSPISAAASHIVLRKDPSAPTGLVGRLWQGTREKIGGIASPVASATAGAIDQLKKETPSLTAHVRTLLSTAVLRPAPADLEKLHHLLTKCQGPSQRILWGEVQEIIELFSRLKANLAEYSIALTTPSGQEGQLREESIRMLQELERAFCGIKAPKREENKQSLSVGPSILPMDHEDDFATSVLSEPVDVSSAILNKIPQVQDILDVLIDANNGLLPKAKKDVADFFQGQVIVMEGAVQRTANTVAPRLHQQLLGEAPLVLQRLEACLLSLQAANYVVSSENSDALDEIRRLLPSLLQLQDASNQLIVKPESTDAAAIHRLLKVLPQRPAEATDEKRSPLASSAPVGLESQPSPSQIQRQDIKSWTDVIDIVKQLREANQGVLHTASEFARRQLHATIQDGTRRLQTAASATIKQAVRDSREAFETEFLRPAPQQLETLERCLRQLTASRFRVKDLREVQTIQTVLADALAHVEDRSAEKEQILSLQQSLGAFLELHRPKEEKDTPVKPAAPPKEITLSAPIQALIHTLDKTLSSSLTPKRGALRNAAAFGSRQVDRLGTQLRDRVGDVTRDFEDTITRQTTVLQNTAQNILGQGQQFIASAQQGIIQARGQAVQVLDRVDGTIGQARQGIKEAGEQAAAVIDRTDRTIGHARQGIKEAGEQAAAVIDRADRTIGHAREGIKAATEQAAHVIDRVDGSIARVQQSIQQLEQTAERVQQRATLVLTQAQQTAETVAARAERTLQMAAGVPNAMARGLGLPVPQMPALSPAVVQPEPTDGKRSPVPAVSQASSPSAVAAQGTWGEYLQRAQSYIAGMIQSASGSVQQQIGTGFASILASSLVWLKNTQLKGNPEGERIVDQLIKAIEAAKTPANWKSVSELLSQSSRQLNGLHVSILGRKITAFGQHHDAEKAKEAFAKNLERSRKALPTPKGPEETFDYAAGIQARKHELVCNLSEYAPLRAVWETVCGMDSPGDQEYFKWMTEARKDKDPTSALRKKLFSEIDRSDDIWVFRKWFAKLSYFLIAAVARITFKQFSDEFISAAEKTINKHDADKFQSFLPQRTSDLKRFTGSLIGAHMAARSPERPISNGLLEMVESELLQPEFNRPDERFNIAYTPAQLYKATASEVVNRFVPRLGWSASIGRFFNRIEIPKTSNARFLNPIVKTFIGLISILIRGVVYMPEMALNGLSRYIFKSFLINHGIVDTIMDKAVGAIQDSNGYTHAVNTLLCSLLEKMWSTMEEEDSAKLGDSISSTHKEDFTHVVRDLFKAIQLYADCTHGQNLGDRSAVEGLSSMLDNLFVDEAVETSALLIAAAIKSIMNKDQFYKQLYNFMGMINESFATGKDVPEKDFKAKEDKIKELLDNILTTAIRKAIRKKLDFGGEQRSKVIDDKMAEIRTSVQTFQQGSQSALAEFRQSANQTPEFFEERLVTPLRKFRDDLARMQREIGASRNIDEPARAAIMSHFVALSAMIENMSTQYTQIGNALGTLRFKVEMCAEVQESLETMARQAKAIVPPPMVNVHLTQGIGFVEMAEDITLHRIRDFYIDKLILMMRRPAFYRHFYHHMALMPFLVPPKAKSKEETEKAKKHATVTFVDAAAKSSGAGGARSRHQRVISRHELPH